MRAPSAAIVLVAALTSACSLLVSTSGLSGGSSADGTKENRDAATAPETAGGASNADGSVEASSSGDAGDPHLLGYWRFDETAGNTATDASGHGHTATLLGATFVVGGKYGGGVALPGNSGAFVYADSLSAPNFPRSGTFSIWFLWTDMAFDDENSVLGGYDTTLDQLLLRHPNRAAVGEFQVAFQDKTLGPSYVRESEFTVTRNSWTHLVVTWDETARVAAVILNGTLLDRGSYTKPYAPSDQAFHVGSQLAGKIDELRLYDRALTEGEAKALP